MAVGVGTPTVCEVCGTRIAVAWWWGDEDPASMEKVRRWWEWPYTDDDLDEDGWLAFESEPLEHTPDRCVAARDARTKVTKP